MEAAILSLVIFAFINANRWDDKINLCMPTYLNKGSSQLEQASAGINSLLVSKVRACQLAALEFWLVEETYACYTRKLLMVPRLRGDIRRGLILREKRAFGQ